MDLMANLQALAQTSFDSGALSGLGAVVHRVTTPGDLRVTLLQGDTPIRSLPLQVIPVPGTGAPGPAPAAPNQLHLDLGRILARVGGLSPAAPTEPLQVGAEGYAMFSAPPHVANFAVQIHPAGAEGRPPVFDSRQLGQGDIFALTMFRPGRYALRNAATGATGEIRVSYPIVGDTPYQPPDPLTVQVVEGGFQPGSIQLKPAQGLIFRVGPARARIQIDLVEPDDGPPRPAAPLHRWQKPAPPSA
jgi:hypothetical protein